MENLLDKPKRKHAPHIHRRLHVLLLVWLVVTFLAAIYPLIWLAPPYIQLTPYVYMVASLGWLPFAFRHIRRHGWRWLTVVLMVWCLASSIALNDGVFSRAYTYVECENNETGLHCFRDEIGFMGGCYYSDNFYKVTNLLILIWDNSLGSCIY